MSGFNKELILWESEDVRQKYKSYLKCFMRGIEGPNIKMKEIELIKYLLAIRKDMRHKNKGIERDDILSLFINNIDEIISELTEQKAQIS
ncbi:hypothetical protein M1E11_23835 (plasmid) [Bacillus sp. JZ8]